ncbi:MAG: hypothetical protein ACW967_01560 [Candidatus Hodarchaeales archaeon]|jgi:hypothetical protein
MSSDINIRISNLEKKMLELTSELNTLKKEKNNQLGGVRKSSSSSVDMELSMTALDKDVKNMQDILKNQTKMMVAFSDFMQNFREMQQSTITGFKEDQIELMKTFQNITSSVTETLRTEFLMVVRDFREKYPDLEKKKIEKELKQVKSPFPSIDSSQVFTTDQSSFLNRKFDEVVVQIERQVQDSLQSVIELISHLLAKVEQLKFVIEEKSVKIEEL